MRCAITVCSGLHYFRTPALSPPSLPLSYLPMGLLTRLASPPLPRQIPLTGNLFDLMLVPHGHEISASFTSHSEAHPLSFRSRAPPPSRRRPHIAASSVGATPPPQRPAPPPVPSLPFLPRHQSIGSLLWLPGQRRASGPHKNILFIHVFSLPSSVLFILCKTASLDILQRVQVNESCRRLFLCLFTRVVNTARPTYRRVLTCSSASLKIP